VYTLAIGGAKAANPDLRSCIVSDPAAVLSLHTFAQDDAMVVQCRGKLIAGVAGTLHAEVRRLIPQTHRIILDLTDLTQMDSMGLGTIVSSYVSAKSAGCDMKLINLRKRIRDLFTIANLSSLFELYGDVQIAAGVNQIGERGPLQ
jgi:anti-sigma B factor antagonist